MKKFISTVKNIFSIEDLRTRIVNTIGFLIIFRLGSFIVLPGVDPSLVESKQAQDGILGLLNMFAGGSFARSSVFALGVMPYISASIVVQLLGIAVPSFQKMQKEGESGRKKLTQYTRYLTVFITAIQAIGYVKTQIKPEAILIDLTTFYIMSGFVLTAGTLFVMWLGEKITDKGIGNGISIIIFTGIVAGLPSALGSTLELARTGAFSIPLVFFLFAATILVTALVVFVERGQRKITVNYAKRQVGNKLYGGQTSHLPLKLNMAGVIPPIFASSIILFPATLAGWFGSSEKMLWLKDIGAAISPGQPIYIFLFALAIVFFCFFYTALVFNPKETADNLKKGGAFVPGIRPGEQTAKYIDQIMGRLTLVGAVYITLVCLLPEFLILKFNVPFYFGGTSLLIIVVVTMDFMTQVQSHLMSYQYEGLLKKANFKGGANALR